MHICIDIHVQSGEPLHSPCEYLNVDVCMHAYTQTNIHTYIHQISFDTLALNKALLGKHGACINAN